MHSSVIGKIDTHGQGPHDGVMSADGKILLLGDRNYSKLSVYNTQTGRIQQQIGPLATNGAQMAVKYINAELGGIDGHPLVLKTCFIRSAEEEGTSPTRAASVSR